MFFRKSLYIHESLKQSLAEAGLVDFEAFINYSGGDRVSRPAKRPVRAFFLEVEGEKTKYFLKQNSTFSFRTIFKALRQHKWPHLDATRERLTIRLFREQDIPVMNVVAWGESWILGLPMKGFIVVEEVVGRGFIKVYRGASLRVRRRLFRLYGELMGTLHRKGIDSKVFPEDIICTSSDYANFRECFVVIDRERGNPYLEELSMEQCGIRLGDIWVKGMFWTGLGERSEMLAFLSGYFMGIGQKDKREAHGVSCERLLDQVFRQATEVLSRDNRFATLRKGFQQRYGIASKVRS